jgi:RiboL-PSP-HEPN
MSEQLLIQFKKELNQIRDYLFYLDKIDEIVAYIPNETDCLSTKSLLETFRKQHIVFEQDKKMFEYKAILISLYGLLEKFIEIWVKAYLDTLCTVVPYHLLPANLQNNHFKQSVSLIAIILEDRWAKYQHLTKEAIIKKLHHCAEQPTQYQLNTDAFVISSGNLKHKRIV